LSDVPKLFRGPLPLDVAFVMVSPPDKHGYCTLGISVDVSIAAVNNAKIVVAQVISFFFFTNTKFLLLFHF